MGELSLSWCSVVALYDFSIIFRQFKVENDFFFKKKVIPNGWIPSTQMFDLENRFLHSLVIYSEKTNKNVNIHLNIQTREITQV